MDDSNDKSLFFKSEALNHLKINIHKHIWDTHAHTSSVWSILYFLILKRFSHLEKYFYFLFCSPLLLEFGTRDSNSAFNFLRTFGFYRLELPYYTIYWRLIIIRTCGRRLSQVTSPYWLYVQATVGQMVQLEAHSLVHNNRSLVTLQD